MRNVKMNLSRHKKQASSRSEDEEVEREVKNYDALLGN